MSRYVPVKGAYWWRIKIGDGEQTIGKFYSKDGADEICRHLDRAFREGYFVASGSVDASYTLPADTVPVSRSALEALRDAISKLRTPMSRTEYAAARACIIEAAYRLLAGDK